jgi:hypothetical protein
LDEYRSTGRPLTPSTIKMVMPLLYAQARAKYRAELSVSKQASLFNRSKGSGLTR